MTLRHLPNAITAFRLLCSAPLAYALWVGNLGWALGLLVLAAVTDILDGALAREFGLQTTAGAWLDPAADKVMITTVLVTLTLMRAVPVWFCCVTMVRDVALATGVVLLMARRVEVKIRPLLSGKLATVAQNLTLLVSILKGSFGLGNLPQALYVLSTALTVVSFLAYLRVYFAHVELARSAVKRT